MTEFPLRPRHLYGLCWRKSTTAALSLLLCMFQAGACRADDSAVISAMTKELDRCLPVLKKAGKAPVYYLGYRVVSEDSMDVSAKFGAIESRKDACLTRDLAVDLRVGTPACDNTHQIRGDEVGYGDEFQAQTAPLPIEDDEAALRSIIWLKTDDAYKQAQKRFARVQAAKDVRLDIEDLSADFSLSKAVDYRSPDLEFKVDRKEWEGKMRNVSRVFKEFSKLEVGVAQFRASQKNTFLVNSEGSKVVEKKVYYNIVLTTEVVAEDGMELWLSKDWSGVDVAELPDESTMIAAARKLAETVMELRNAPVAEPYVGPAILRNKAAAVFIHEVIGHRLEGHRQKNLEEGRTFADKVGTSILPPVISICDDPTREKFVTASGNIRLNGYYKIDDEGVEAQRVNLVENGVLKNFLMSRTPIAMFEKSNGHGRAATSYSPVARQANLIVEVDPTNRVPFDEMRKQLVKMIKAQGKPYGLLFEEVQGGSTSTRTEDLQAFQINPLIVKKVFADGRPDELTRGVNIVGTPLAMLESVIHGGADPDVFNGSCGAESGWVPVSAVSPSFLLDTIEVERVEKSSLKQPLLENPLNGKGKE